MGRCFGKLRRHEMEGEERQGWVGVGQAGSGRRGLRGCSTASERWKTQHWPNWKQRITVAFQGDGAELFASEKQRVRVAWLCAADP